MEITLANLRRAVGNDNTGVENIISDFVNSPEVAGFIPALNYNTQPVMETINAYQERTIENTEEAYSGVEDTGESSYTGVPAAIPESSGEGTGSTVDVGDAGSDI